MMTKLAKRHISLFLILSVIGAIRSAPSTEDNSGGPIPINPNSNNTKPETTDEVVPLEYYDDVEEDYAAGSTQPPLTDYDEEPHPPSSSSSSLASKSQIESIPVSFINWDTIESFRHRTSTEILKLRTELNIIIHSENNKNHHLLHQISQLKKTIQNLKTLDKEQNDAAIAKMSNISNLIDEIDEENGKKFKIINDALKNQKNLIGRNDNKNSDVIQRLRTRVINVEKGANSKITGVENTLKVQIERLILKSER